ncbi:MAG: CPCC family cysteine-rich protein [Chloroflexota bacterium]
MQMTEHQITYPCACCGYFTLHEPGGSYEICPVCFWEADPIQNDDPEYVGGANRISLNEARRNFAELGAVDREMRQHVRPPRDDERSPSGPRVSVVLVHWERASVEDTVACLESLAATTYPRLSTILVNNGATGLPDEPFLKALPGLRIIRTTENLGFTGGNNVGIRSALADGADYVLLLNNDTVVSPKLVEKLLAAFDRPEVGIVGPIVTYFSHPNRAWFAGGRYNRYLGYTFHTLMGDELTGPLPNQPTDFVTACALLARREVFERVGLLWDALFIYFEDAELCLRAARGGFQCVLVGEPLVRHKVSASMGAVGELPFSPLKGYYFGRNPLLMARRGLAGPWSAIGLLGVIYPYNILQCLKRRNWRALRGYLAGIRDGVLGRHGPR